MKSIPLAIVLMVLSPQGLRAAPPGLVQIFVEDVPLHLHGHPFAHTANGMEYVYFGDPYPVMRVRATTAALLDPSQYEGFTCLTPGSRASSAKVERDANGKVVWGWKRERKMGASCALKERIHKRSRETPTRHRVTSTTR